MSSLETKKSYLFRKLTKFHNYIPHSDSRQKPTVMQPPLTTLVHCLLLLILVDSFRAFGECGIAHIYYINNEFVYYITRNNKIGSL